MAATTVRSTYAFDPETVERLERLAQRWQLSRSATLRKLIREADQPARQQEIAERLAALDRYQAAMRHYSDEQMEKWAREVREERHASSRARMEKLERWSSRKGRG